MYIQHRVSYREGGIVGWNIHTYIREKLAITPCTVYNFQFHNYNYYYSKRIETRIINNTKHFKNQSACININSEQVQKQ